LPKLKDVKSKDNSITLLQVKWTTPINNTLYDLK
jgi:hypothetical protein